MECFFDTSAVVPLLLEELHTPAAPEALDGCTRVFAWRWLQVETESALARRQAPPAAWSEWRVFSSAVHWLELGEDTLPQLCSFNRPLRLRAADAGHLFVFERALRVLPELKLVCFDQEMNAAARTLGLPYVEGGVD